MPHKFNSFYKKLIKAMVKILKLMLRETVLLSILNRKSKLNKISSLKVLKPTKMEIIF